MFNGNLIFSFNSLYKFLSSLFTTIFKYTITPKKFMNIQITPIISKDNDGPMSISCTISKVFESIIINKCKRYLSVNDNQFVFKPKKSTIMCVQVLNKLFHTTMIIQLPFLLVFLI